MRKKLLSLMITVVILSLLTATVYGGTTDTRLPGIEISELYIDGELVATHNQLIYVRHNGDALFPLRVIAEEIGFNVIWDSSSSSVGLINEYDKIWLNIRDNRITKNQGSRISNYDIQIINSRTYVSLDFIIEILGVGATYDRERKTIDIHRPSSSLEALDLTEEEKEIKNVLVSYLSSLQLNRYFSGQVLVTRDGKVLVHRSYGYGDNENRIRVLDTTNFAIGSITKQFTAAAIIMLEEENKLSFHDKISKYISDIPFGDEITIHQLLTHTSGLYEFTNNLGELLLVEEPDFSFEGIIKLIENKPLTFEPGSRFEYNNTNYLILGRIVEKVSDKSLIDFFEENIFNPVGMNNTMPAFNDSIRLLEARGYAGNIPDFGDEILLRVAYGAGYLTSTVQDLYNWNVSLLSGEIISEENLNRKFGQDPDLQLIYPYGYGWMFMNGPFGKEIFHGGNTLGFTSLNTIFTDKNNQIIILTNKQYVNLSEIKDNIAIILDGGVVLPKEERVYIELTDEQLEAYTGVYEIQNILRIHILKKDGRLIFQGEGQPPIELKALSETKFEALIFGISIEFDSNDNPRMFTLNQLGLQLPAVKVDTEKIIVSEEILKGYEGSYEIKGMLKIEIFIKEGQLMLRGEGQPEVELTPVSETRFEALHYGIAIEFNSKETPNQFILYQAGFEFIAERL